MNEPKKAIGMWSFPADPPADVLLGYCVEKISNGFQCLRRITRWEQNLDRTTKKHRVTDVRSATASSSSGKKKALEAFKTAVTRFETDQELDLLLALANDDELLEALPIKEKGVLVMLLGKRHGKRKIHYQNAALNVLFTIREADEFQQVLFMMGGRKSAEQEFQGVELGRFLFLLEKFRIDPWSPPFMKNVTVGSALVELETLQETLMEPDQTKIFLNGSSNAATMLGLSPEELKRMAERAYEMLTQGKLEIAQQVFDGLVYLDPLQPYFYTVLGSVRQQLGDTDGALVCYSNALVLQPENVNAAANRGEIHFEMGNFQEALNDFQRVLELDPKGENPSTSRCKMLIVALQTAIEKTTASAVREAL